jgi:hypothetical protein
MLHHMATILVCYGGHFESKMAVKLCIRKTAELPSNSGSAQFHVSWLFDFIFYQKPLYKSLHQSFFYFGSHFGFKMAAIVNQNGRHMVQHVLLPVNIHFH